MVIERFTVGGSLWSLVGTEAELTALHDILRRVSSESELLSALERGVLEDTLSAIEGEFGGGW